MSDIESVIESVEIDKFNRCETCLWLDSDNLQCTSLNGNPPSTKTDPACSHYILQDFTLIRFKVLNQNGYQLRTIAARNMKEATYQFELYKKEMLDNKDNYLSQDVVDSWKLVEFT